MTHRIAFILSNYPAAWTVLIGIGFLIVIGVFVLNERKYR